MEDGAPDIIELGTPKRCRPRGAPSSTDSAAGTPCLSGVRGSSPLGSPCLGEDWLPLEYELLEYADLLPRDFVDRMGCELEAQERRVAELRNLNVLLEDLCGSAPTPRPAKESRPLFHEGEGAGSQEAVGGPGADDEGSRHGGGQEEAGEAAPPARADAPGGARPRDDAGARAEISQEAARRRALEESAQQLDAVTMEVRGAAEAELAKLSRRLRAAEEQKRAVTLVAAYGAGDRKRLWEAEAEQLRLRARLQQLEAARHHAERRADQREEDGRLLEADASYLQAEVRGFRATVSSFAALDQQEVDLRCRLRSAKLALRHEQRSGAREAARMKENVPVVPPLALPAWNKAGLASARGGTARDGGAPALPGQQPRAVLQRSPPLSARSLPLSARSLPLSARCPQRALRGPKD